MLGSDASRHLARRPKTSDCSDGGGTEVSPGHNRLFSGLPEMVFDLRENSVPPASANEDQPRV
jgi:hypothetical protein